MHQGIISDDACSPEVKRREPVPQRVQFASALLELRFWADANLPIYRSLICYDLVIVIAAHAGANGPVSLKRIYRLLPYSESHLRMQLRRLEKDNWIRLVIHPTDARNRVIEPTPMFLDAFEKYRILLVRTVKQLADA